MDEIFRRILIMSAAGGLLSLVLLVVRPLTRKHFSSGWQYYIWLSVLLVMTVPVFLPEREAAPPITGAQEEQVAVETRTAQGQGAETLSGRSAGASDEPSGKSGEPGSSGQFVQSGKSGEPGSSNQSSQSGQSEESEKSGQFSESGESGRSGASDALRQEPQWRPLRYLGLHMSIPEQLAVRGCLIWFGVALALLVWRIARYRLFIRTIRRYSREDGAAVQTGAKRLEVKKTDMLEAPLLAGLFRPVLYLPEAGLDRKDLQFILAHELTHYRRHDLLYKWFMMAVKSIHWFNPFIYVVSRQVDTECEVSCDAAVTGRMSEQEKDDYMKMILRLMAERRGRTAPMTTPVAGTKKLLVRRFKAIRRKKAPRKVVSAISVLTAFFMLSSAVFASSILSEITDDACTVVVKDAEGAAIEYTDRPFVQNNHVYLPLRETFEQLGYAEGGFYIGWDDGTIDVAILAYPMNNGFFRVRVGEPFLNCSISRDTRLDGKRIGETLDHVEASLVFEDYPVPVLRDSTVYVPSDMMDYIFYGFFGKKGEDNSLCRFECRVYDKNGREVQMERPDTERWGGMNLPPQ